jgi:endonuclease YncB( thermonuclease family)
MKRVIIIITISILFLVSGCVSERVTETSEDTSSLYYTLPTDFEYDGPEFPSSALSKSFFNNDRGGLLKVSLDDCTDGDTARFKVDGQNKNTRFFNIDTQESTREKEEWGKPASIYTCNVLENANEIYLQSDPGDGPYDKYDRLLAWIWVDGELLQYHLVSLGLAEVKYLYGADMYTSYLKLAQQEAKAQNLGQWSDLLDPYWNYETNKPKGW